jgi:hypothetical protein
MNMYVCIRNVLSCGHKAIFWMAMLCFFTSVVGDDDNENRKNDNEVVLPSQEDPPYVVYKY